MKTRMIFTLAALMAAATTARAQGPKPPPPLPMGPVSFPAFAERTLKNGAQVLVVENHEQPIVSMAIFIRGAGQTSDIDAKPGVATAAANLLDAGTAARTSKQIAETIEGLGANVSTSAGPDWATVNATMLKADVDAVLVVIGDMLVNASYPADEVETERKRSITDLQVALSQPARLAQRQFEARVFGSHPYGRLTTTTSLRAITREDLVQFHKTFYKPSNALIVVAGDVNPADITAKLQQHLAGWTGTAPVRPKFASAPATKREIVLVNKPGAVQAAFRIGHTYVPAAHPDLPALTVASYILGGGSNGWLFSNLREKKGFTYGAYAQAAQRLDPGYFLMFGDVRNEVADSAFQLFIDLGNQLRAEPVPASDLDLAKSYLTGTFPLSIETPQQIAGQVAQALLLGQAKDHVQTWRQRLAAVTAADVQRVARQFINPDNALVVVSGDASILKSKLEKFGKVTVVDEEGKPVADAPPPAPAATGIDASSLQPMTATYVVSANGMQVAEMSRALTRETLKGKDVVKVKNTMTGMQNMTAELVFEARTFAPVSSSMTMQAGGMEMNSILSVTNGKVAGMLKMPQATDPQMIDAAFAEGTLLSGMEEVALMLTDFSATKELSFNVFNAATSSVIPVTVKLTGESKQKVAAGEFDAYELHMTTAQGGMKVYVRKAAPHVVLKQEMEAAPIVVELKEIK